MVYPLPDIEATGIYTAREPFNVDNTILYRCAAIQSFDTLELLGIDAFKTYYEPMGLEESDFIDDKEAGVKIVVLRPIEGDLTPFYLPSSYLDSFPSTSVVPYNEVNIILEVGLLPRSVNLDLVEQDLLDVVKSHLGVNAAVVLLREDLDNGLAYEQSVALEKARTANITYRPSAKTTMENTLSDMEELRAYIEELELIITDNIESNEG